MIGLVAIYLQSSNGDLNTVPSYDSSSCLMLLNSVWNEVHYLTLILDINAELL